MTGTGIGSYNQTSQQLSAVGGSSESARVQDILGFGKPRQPVQQMSMPQMPTPQQISGGQQSIPEPQPQMRAPQPSAGLIYSTKSRRPVHYTRDPYNK